MATLSPYTSDAKGRPRSAAEIVTAAGTRIYLLPVETFPGHVNNVYLVDHPDHALLFDVGTLSGHEELQMRFREIQDRFGVKTGLSSVREALISHAHVDHFGNAGSIRDMGISIAIHELDARVLAGFTERLALASRDIGSYLRHAGLDAAAARDLVDLYRTSKHFFHDLKPDRRLKNGEIVGPGWRVLHVPGHCPGMVCLAVDDVVLTADHLLSRITPIQSPQSITPYVGLENYLRSLEKLRDFGLFQLGLGAHEAPITDVRGRIDTTIAHHAERMRRVHSLCEERTLTIAEVSQALFGTTKSYGVLLALLEAGAHVEYLHELGYLTIENVHDVADDPTVAARYRALVS